MIKGVAHAHLGLIWYHSEPSDVPYSTNQFIGWDFFAASYSKTALVTQMIKALAESAAQTGKCIFISNMYNVFQNLD